MQILLNKEKNAIYGGGGSCSKTGRKYGASCWSQMPLTTLPSCPSGTGQFGGGDTAHGFYYCYLENSHVVTLATINSIYGVDGMGCHNANTRLNYYFISSDGYRGKALGATYTVDDCDAT